MTNDELYSLYLILQASYDDKVLAVNIINTNKLNIPTYHIIGFYLMSITQLNHHQTLSIIKLWENIIDFYKYTTLTNNNFNSWNKIPDSNDSSQYYKDTSDSISIILDEINSIYKIESFLTKLYPTRIKCLKKCIY